jgi:hypothetical protein
VARVELTGVGPTGAPLAVAVEDAPPVQWLAEEALRLYVHLGGVMPPPFAAEPDPPAPTPEQPDETSAERELSEAGYHD